jgi:hypothetical protein
MSSTLILNADMHSLLAYYLCQVIEWQEAIRYLVLDKGRGSSNGTTIGSFVQPIGATRVPAVLMLKEYQKPKHRMRMTKRNIFLRDRVSVPILRLPT